MRAFPLVDLQPALSSLQNRIRRFKSKVGRPAEFNAFTPSTTSQVGKSSAPPTTRVEIHYKSSPSSAQLEYIGCAVVSALVLLAFALLLFGFERVLVAGEAFFLFSAWAALRAADLLRTQQAVRLEAFRQYMVIFFGLCSGCLAAYLILTTSEGQAITE